MSIESTLWGYWNAPLPFAAPWTENECRNFRELEAKNSSGEKGLAALTEKRGKIYESRTVPIEIPDLEDREIVEITSRHWRKSRGDSISVVHKEEAPNVTENYCRENRAWLFLFRYPLINRVTNSRKVQQFSRVLSLLWSNCSPFLDLLLMIFSDSRIVLLSVKKRGREKHLT